MSRLLCAITMDPTNEAGGCSFFNLESRKRIHSCVQEEFPIIDDVIDIVDMQAKNEFIVKEILDELDHHLEKFDDQCIENTVRDAIDESGNKTLLLTQEETFNNNKNDDDNSLMPMPEE